MKLVWIDDITLKGHEKLESTCQNEQWCQANHSGFHALVLLVLLENALCPPIKVGYKMSSLWKELKKKRCFM